MQWKFLKSFKRKTINNWNLKTDIRYAIGGHHFMSRDAKTPGFCIFDQVWHNPTCATTKEG